MILDLPSELGQLSRPDRMINVLKAAALAWEPEWAGVMLKDSIQLRRFNTRVPFVDWMLYVPGAVRNLAQPSTSIELPGLSTLVVVQPNPTSGSDATELMHIRSVEDLIRPDESREACAR